MQDWKPTLGIITCAIVMTVASIYGRIEWVIISLVIGIAIGLREMKFNCDAETVGMVMEPAGNFRPALLVILGLGALFLTVFFSMVTQ